MYRFNLDEDSFLRLTLRQFNDIVELWKDDRKALDFRAALTPWFLANLHRSKDSEQVPISDFMPNYDEPESEGKSWEEMKHAAAMMTVALGGTIETKEAEGI